MKCNQDINCNKPAILDADDKGHDFYCLEHAQIALSEIQTHKDDFASPEDYVAAVRELIKAINVLRN